MVRKNRDKEKGKIEEEKTKLAKETACLIASKKQTNKQTKTVIGIHEQLMNERRNLWSRQLINQSVSRSYAKHFFHLVFFDERFDK